MTDTSENCDPDQRPICDVFNPVPYSSIMMSTNLFNGPLTVLGIYVILYKSSKAMKIYSWFLLFHVVALEFVNIQYTLLILPYFIFPVWGGMAVGLYSQLNVSGIVQLFILMTSITIVTTSTIWLFYYRAQVVLPENHRLKHGTKGMFIFMVTLLVGNMAAGLHLCFLFVQGQSEDAMKEEYYRKFACKMDIVYDSRIRVMNPQAAQYLMLFFVFYFLAIIFFVTLFTAPIFRHLLRDSNLSKSTKKLQLSFLRALSIQISINFMLIIFPTMVWIAFKGTAANRQHVNEICVVVQSLNHTGDLLALILLNKPYREVILCRKIFPTAISSKKLDTKISLL